MKSTKLKLTARWDKNVVPADKPRRRGLLIELEGTSDEKVVERRGINLALSIDRSGSMGTVNMEAAKKAAIGVVERMSETDVLSIVDFDSRVTVLIDGLEMTPGNKAEAIAAIHTLHARSCTALGAGWFEAANCASKAIDTGAFSTGHILLISDGHANEGLTDPMKLSKHAVELANRGVTTSTVGIGAGYSPLQLEALAEGGRGRMHDAEGGSEIIEVIMGELGETRSIVATDADLIIRWPAGLRGEVMANFETASTAGRTIVSLGHLVNGLPRAIPVTFEVPGSPEGETLDIEIVAEAKCPEAHTLLEAAHVNTALSVVSPAESASIDRDKEVAERIARLWENTRLLEAMRINERGDFVGAAHFVRSAGEELRDFAADLDALSDISSNLMATERQVSRSWEGRSKREAMISAKKFAKSERDHRRNRR